MSKLYDLRVAKGFSQKKLGEMVGITRHAISGFEKGKYNPSVRVAKMLAAVLGCKWWELYEGEASEEWIRVAGDD